MKSLIYIFGIILISAGCNVLDVEPTDSIPASSAFKDKAGIERGIMGSYSSLQSLSYYGRAFITYGDLAADNLEHPVDATNADYGEIDNNNILPENGAVGGTWAVIYDGINVANNVIVKVPGMSDMTDSEKNQALGELYFLRALNHFNLLNYFGAIPIKIQPTVGVGDLDAGRDPVDMVYLQITDDLKFAEQNLPSSASNKIRASKYAATALLARVYLYKGDYDLAWEKANDVITGGGYTLLDKFADVFSADGSAETIFEIDFIGADRNRIAEYNFPKTLNGRREVAPTSDIISAFDPGDERKDVSIAFEGANAYANKYNDLSIGADNVIVLRLAEMFLIRAEAEVNKLNPDLALVKADINTIRSRANLNPTSENTVEDLLMAIEKERRTEFAFEGQRWFDLVRTGRAIDVIPTVTNNNQTLFPIPLSEIQTNKSPEMIQNQGYN
jgi:starch-binding outer membrane protein, SusD/RagB family